ncbi:hypothetical protein Ancab_024969 [Ancistrocladus abbreviatus]
MKINIQGAGSAHFKNKQRVGSRVPVSRTVIGSRPLPTTSAAVISHGSTRLWTQREKPPKPAAIAGEIDGWLLTLSEGNDPSHQSCLFVQCRYPHIHGLVALEAGLLAAGEMMVVLPEFEMGRFAIDNFDLRGDKFYACATNTGGDAGQRGGDQEEI